MSKEFDSNQSLHQKILRGADTLADNVASTLGPRGRNVILHQKGKNPIITKDGVTVAKFVTLDDPFENVGAQIIKQASEQTNSKAGDGTTTATVLARSILKEAQKYITSGVSPVELKRGIDHAVGVVVEQLHDMAKPIMSEKDIAHIATISANGDTLIGNLIANAVDQVGKNGAITVEESRSLDTMLDIVEGFRFDAGYVSSQFVNDERRGVVKYENPFIMVTDHKVEMVDDLLPILEVVAREARPLIIVSEQIEGQALAALIMNALRGTMKVAAVKAPRYGEERRNILKDLAISTGATFISRESGLNLKEAKLEHLGSSKSIEVEKSFTTVVDGAGMHQDVEQRIEDIKQELAQTDDMYECERIQERITRLASGIAIIRVGAATEIEMIEKRHRVEDALEAVKSAQQEGIVPGGGAALLKASLALQALEVDNDEQDFGVEVITDAALAPIRQMAKNAGESPDLIISEVLDSDPNWGFDFSRCSYCDLIEEGIIDPVKVTRVALQNAASAASTLLTTNYAIIEK